MASMKEHETFPGKLYAVMCATGCTLTDDSGRNEEIEAGKQFTFIATAGKVYTSEPATVKLATFNRAALEHGLLGGGVKSELPAGYLACEFLESTGTQYIDTLLVPDSTSKVKMSFAITQPQSYKAYYGVREDQEKDFYSRNNGANSSLNVHIGKYYTTANYEAGKRYELLVHVAKSEFEFDEKIYTVAKSAVKPTRTAFIFAHNSGYGTHNSSIKCWSFDITNAKKDKKFVPAVDSMGVPCMFDKVSKLPFYNSGTGAFIAGFTREQARKLAKLSTTGGALTISLPTGYEQDGGVMDALETARAKGWTLTVQTYAAEAGASTFALRRIWVRKTQSEHGGYVDADGVRYSVECGHADARRQRA